MLKHIDYTEIILLEGFCPLKVEIARFPILFRRLNSQYPIVD